MYGLLILIFNQGYNFYDSFWNDFLSKKVLCLNLCNIAIVAAKNVDYRCIIYNISKSDAIRLPETSVLDDRGYI